MPTAVRAGVEALLAEEFTDQVRCPIHHLGLAVEALGGDYVAGYLREAGHVL